MDRHFGEHHDEIVELSKLLLATWQRVEPNSNITKYPASHVESFTDMAKAVVEAGYHRAPSSLDTDVVTIRLTPAELLHLWSDRPEGPMVGPRYSAWSKLGFEAGTILDRLLPDEGEGQ